MVVRRGCAAWGVYRRRSPLPLLGTGPGRGVTGVRWVNWWSCLHGATGLGLPWSGLSCGRCAGDSCGRAFGGPCRAWRRVALRPVSWCVPSRPGGARRCTTPDLTAMRGMIRVTFR